MNTLLQPPAAPTGPGFVTVILDIPFPLALPNGCYTVLDPAKEIAVVQSTLREGSRAFFRNTPIVGPTSFNDLRNKARDFERPRQGYSYLLTSQLTDGTQKATLNIDCGTDGGFAETKYYSEVQITFLEEDLGVLGRKDEDLLQRATGILNPFLDKYRLFAEDYRVARVSGERNFYFAACHSSALTPEERGLTATQLFASLSGGRTFLHQLGHGGANILRPNSFDRLGPRSEVTGSALGTLAKLLQFEYEMPLSYDLIMQAIRCLQMERDFKLAIVHAATAVEVHVLHLLHGLLVALGSSAPDAWSLLENDPEYEGATRRLKRLESHTKTYCEQNGMSYKQFVGCALYEKWRDTLAHKRNRAVHAGVASFTWGEAAEAIGIAKESIVFIDQRLPALANPIQLNPSVANLRDGAGGILFG
jgi:hypothetical protein